MDNGQHFKRLVLLVTIIAAMAIVPACKQAPEEHTPPPQKADLEALTLPQQNKNTGITLDRVPADHVVTFNDSEWLQITDEWNPAIVYSFVRSTESDPGPTPPTPEAFEKRVFASPQGKILDRGTMETSFGSADWISASYIDDDGVVEDIHLYAPHPSGSGSVILTSVSPLGVKSQEDRLKVIQEILTHAS